MKYDLSLTIPFYNEEDCAKEVIEELVRVLESNSTNYELILVDNGSSDKTLEILQSLSNERLKILKLSPNRGFGGGILEGLKASNAKYLGFTCGDGEVSSEDTYKVYNRLIKGNSEICKAIRTSRTDNFLKIIYSKSYNVLVKLFFNLRIKDINGYPLIMKKTVYESLSLKERDWLFNLEILYQAKKQNLNVEEIIIKHRRRVSGKSSDFSFSNLLKPIQPFLLMYYFLKYRLKN